MARRRIIVDLTVLRESRDLRLLTAGQTVSALGTQAALVAVPYQVYVLSYSTALVGLLGLVSAGTAVVSGGLACVAGVGVVMAAFPALARLDGQRKPEAVAPGQPSRAVA